MFIKVGKRLNKKAVIIFFVITAFLQKKMKKTIYIYVTSTFTIKLSGGEKWSIP